MKTEDYKKLFKGFPERAWLSSALQSIIKGADANELMDYLIGTKNIDDVNEIEKLYKIKASFLMLSVHCQAIQDNIDKLGLAFIGEFEDKQMSLEEIGISTNDIFECINDFSYQNMVKINAGSRVKVMELSYAGSNSQLYCRFVSHETDEQTRKHFPNSDEIKMLYGLKEFGKKFKKI